MHFSTLPVEILTQVFLSLPTISSVISLASTCHRFHDAYHSSRRRLILSEAAEREFGPVDDIVQLVTQNSSQPAHVRRDVPISDALILQIIKIGKVARKWETIYPHKKWKDDFENRRTLTEEECFRLRRALYRLWLFGRAFHNNGYVRTARSLPQVKLERAALLHNFPVAELAEMQDVYTVMRDMVAQNICPSNGRIRQKFQKRHPDSNHQLLFNIHLNYPLPAPAPFLPSINDYNNSSYLESKYHSRLQPSRWHEPGGEGWGDEILHYYVVEDMMKLDPEQILWLRDHCPYKQHVECYVKGLGEWFNNNGQTFGETLDFVTSQRGGDTEELKAMIEDGEMGVAVCEM
ncbi:hypothetical protein K431DRAFT_298803 [Polychaeton citri CBS 116435]|uniref:F-box domain-containing protein n=1 Tax=Polychaeton citri CBS 116435 TaxID=1314669 RepID=A0A9P4PYT0_9PEZI|nr:hypothetical protein K431DRAFT_298803 [Polychaeton citri CBS 116435]